MLFQLIEKVNENQISSLTELARELDASVEVVREALVLLSQKGKLIFRPLQTKDCKSCFLSHSCLNKKSNIRKKIKPLML